MHSSTDGAYVPLDYDTRMIMMHQRSPHYSLAVLLGGGAAFAVLEAVLATALAGGGLTELGAVFFVAAVEAGSFLGGILGILPKIELQN